jgi:xanthine/uracil permease
MSNYVVGAVFYCIGLSLVGGAIGSAVAGWLTTSEQYFASAVVLLSGVMSLLRGSELLRQEEN